MVKRRRVIIAFPVLLLSTILACGDFSLQSEDQKSQGQSPQDTDRSLLEKKDSTVASRASLSKPAKILLTEQALPECTEKNLNAIVFFLGDRSFRYCSEEVSQDQPEKKTWISISVAQTGGLGQISENCKQGQILRFDRSQDPGVWVCSDDLESVGNQQNTDLLKTKTCQEGQAIERQASGFGCGSIDGNTLLDLTCGTNQVPKWNGTAWACQADDNTQGFFNLNCQNDQLAQWNGTSWVCKYFKAPQTLALSATSLKENRAGAEIGTISATDPNGGSLEYSIYGGKDAHLFEISGNKLKLKPNIHFDYETRQKHYVSLEARNTSGLSSKKLFTISVDNLFVQAISCGYGLDGSSNAVSAKLLMVRKNGQSWESTELTDSGSNCSSLGVGDFNRDGRSDVFMTWSGSTNLYLFERNTTNALGASMFTRKTAQSIDTTPTDVVAQARDLAVGDLNGDGFDDVFIGFGSYWNAANYKDHYILGNGDGTFNTPVVSTSKSATSAVVLGDFLRNGRLDVFIANKSTKDQVFENKGTANPLAGESQIPHIKSSGGSSYAEDSLEADIQNSGAVVSADFSGDTHADVFVAVGQGVGRVLLNAGSLEVGGVKRAKFDEKAISSTESGLASSPQNRSAAFGDFDADGDFDVIVGTKNATGSYNEIYVNDGNGVFARKRFRIKSGQSSLIDTTSDDWNTLGVAVGDLDGDGKSDIYFANYAQDDKIFLNRFDGTTLKFELVTISGSHPARSVVIGEFE